MRYCFIFFYLSVTILVAQQTKHVDFLTANVNVLCLKYSKEISASVDYTLDILNPVDSIYIDAQRMRIHSVTFNNDSIDWHYNTNKIVLHKPFKASKANHISITYTAKPIKAMYFIDWDKTHTSGNPQIWTQGQGKYTSNWLPSFDDTNEKVTFNIAVTAPKAYNVISNGKLAEKTINDTLVTWHYTMKHPMSSYLVALGIGNFKKKVKRSRKGVPLEMYYYPQDTSKFEPTYRYTKRIFDVLEKEIGVKYPWQNYKMLPVKDFLYAGMENTTLNIFSDAFVVDSTAFNDRNFVNINAHELAHQWFGDMVTAKTGADHWLQEGFATYYALLAEKNVFGDFYYYWRLYQYAQELHQQDIAGQSTSILNPKSSSTTFYKKGAWILHLLREKVGDKAFKKTVKTYLKTHKFKNVTTRNFMDALADASGMPLKAFYKTWLENKTLPYNAMLEALKNNSKNIDFKTFLALDCSTDKAACRAFLETPAPPQFKAFVIKQLKGDIPNAVFNDGNLEIRQAIALTTTVIPIMHKATYESFLHDASYRTVEAALYNLWRNFPEDRNRYLDTTKHYIGFNDKNIRTLWLALALITEGYNTNLKPNYLKELTNYASNAYGFEVRQNALQLLDNIQACDKTCKGYLKDATKHHNWRFKKFAKTLLEANK